MHGLGQQLIRKSALCAVRTDRRNFGLAIGHHRAAESCREQLFQGGARKRRYFCCNCIDPRHLRALARRTQQVLAMAPQTAGATLGRATDRSPIKMHHLEGYTGLECHVHAHNRSSAPHTHQGIPLHPKDARNSTSYSARNSRARHPTRPSICTYLEHCTGQEWHTHNHRNAPHSCFQHAQRHRGITLHAKGARNRSTC